MEGDKLGVLFADLSGTTRLFRKIGTSEAQRALERCTRRLERAVAKHGGAFLPPQGDELVAVFGHADALLQAAIEIRERLAGLPPVSGVKFAVRIGVHFGPHAGVPAEAHGELFDAGRALLQIAGPHQIVTCARTAEVVSAPLRPLLRSMEDLSIPLGDDESQLYEVCWPEDSLPAGAAGGEPARPPAPPAKAGEARFCVRLNGKAYLIDERSPSLTIGRDKECDIVIGSRKASRQHVRLEKRGRNRFFMIDQSTNGTFVVVGKENERFLHHEEIQLSGHGRFACGHSTANPEADVADFEVL